MEEGRRDSPAMSRASVARPTVRVTAITHRTIRFARTVEGALPGSFPKRGLSSIMRSAIGWNVLDRAGIPGVTDVWGPRWHATTNLLVRSSRPIAQAKQVAKRSGEARLPCALQH